MRIAVMEPLGVEQEKFMQIAREAVGNDVEIAHGLPPSGSICRCKSQQLVPVIFILFLPCFDFGGQAGGKVSAEGVKTVER